MKGSQLIETIAQQIVGIANNKAERAHLTHAVRNLVMASSAVEANRAHMTMRRLVAEEFGVDLRAPTGDQSPTDLHQLGLMLDLLQLRCVNLQATQVRHDAEALTAADVDVTAWLESARLTVERLERQIPKRRAALERRSQKRSRQIALLN